VTRPSRSLLLSRRATLATFAAAALMPRTVWAAPSPPFRSLLDRAAATADPKQRLALIRGFVPSGTTDAAVHMTVARGLEREIALRAVFPFGKPDGSSPYVVSPRHGAYLRASEDDPKIASLIDAETGQLRRDASHGVAPPAFLLDAVLEAERDTIARNPAVEAALSRQITVLEGLRRGAPTSPGVWRLPKGRDYFAARLRCTTGTGDGPAELDRRVGAETASLLARADSLLRTEGLSHGSVGARLRALKSQGRGIYPNDEAGRTRAVADMNAALDRLRPLLPNWFNPPFDPGAAVKRMTPADEAAKRRGYREAAAYYPDLSNVSDRPAWTLTTVAYHETVPGHLLQLQRQGQADPHPLQLRYAAGYAEGWAIYAESLADATGPLSPLERLGFLQSVLFRLARVTADIGIHFHRWDRARAIAYLRETVGFELFFPFDVEIDRYCIEPAGFAGDAAMAIALRTAGARARERGAAEARRFHDRVLNDGPLSLEALRTLV
jgi:uncharacterized protein (DUF885 family)